MQERRRERKREREKERERERERERGAGPGKEMRKRAHRHAMGSVGPAFDERGGPGRHRAQKRRRETQADPKRRKGEEEGGRGGKKTGRTFLFAVFGPQNGHFRDKKNPKKNPDSHSTARGKNPPKQKPKIDRTLETQKIISEKTDRVPPQLFKKSRQVGETCQDFSGNSQSSSRTSGGFS